ncbi:hypothetical protein [Helcococcus ovis]|uniref:hypothetical protein n=3 Tax=Helcococcus ovis TaxID=72026 RepID=UPI001070589A|nr:hypothetical protein [Helcococcus ovis]TFF67883.1 hypothetical protein EQF93_04185 [Helcococcus ovis]WNZ01569.1 hypothetical protein EQF90_001595 [Helcococcus ovis]
MQFRYFRLRTCNIVKSTIFQFAILFIFVFALIDYFYSISYNLNKFANFTLSSFKLFMGFPDDYEIILTSYFYHVFAVLIAVIPTSVIYLEDKFTGKKNYFLINLGRKNYYFINCFVVFITTFIMFLLPLGINFLISIIGNFKNGPNLLDERGFFINIMDSKLLFKSMFIYSPYIVNIIHFIFCLIFYSIWATFVYSLSLIYNKFNKINLVIFSIIIFILINFILSFSGHTNIFPIHYLFVEYNLVLRLNLLYFILDLIILIILSFIFINIKVLYLKDEL